MQTRDSSLPEPVDPALCATGHRGRVALLVGLVAWVSLAGIGFTQVFVFQTTPGVQGAAPDAWPSGSRIERADGTNTIVMFVHPMCTCTRASLSELNAIMESQPADTAAVVVFLGPDGADAGWDGAGTWETAGRIAHTSRVVDRESAEAARFGAYTSGHVVVYDASGRRLFTGGITNSRGQAGDNMGRRSILALLGSAAPLDRAHAVFGCPLFDTGSRHQHRAPAQEGPAS